MCASSSSRTAGTCITGRPARARLRSVCIVERDGRPAPLEVKAEENVHAKSLRALCSDTGLHGYRSSMRGYREQDWMTNVPLWAVGPYFAPENDAANIIPSRIAVEGRIEPAL